MPTDLEALRRRLGDGAPPPLVVEGRVASVRGSTVRASLPGARVGDAVVIERASGPLLAEVAGFDDALAVLCALGDVTGVGMDDVVRTLRVAPRMPCGEGLLGRVVDAFGEALDDGGALEGPLTPCALDVPAPPALRRGGLGAPLALGLRAVDALCTVVEGQRVGVFAPPGAGKTRLLLRAARDAPVDAVVVALVGERGREVREFVEALRGGGAHRRACVVVATSDAAPGVRVRAAFAATTLAEHLRDGGRRVLLVVDSLTRVARAQRDLGLAAGEPAVRRALPPSVFTLLPRLLERAGPGARGSITALFTVLTEAHADDDPVAEEARGLLDGHLVLDRALAAVGHWPAVDVLRSLSRCMDGAVTAAHRDAASRVRGWLARVAESRDLVAMGAYAKGRDPALDEALARRAQVEAFLRQTEAERVSLDESVRTLLALAR